ncbi:hypothetical protein [Caldimonas brevitalea]|uniref:DUF2812 domain-containing protein n=1 Tax=Caldimonas brevitalea TaxID=413882 RepID=A0A0G3BI84_9BURK|nr:hypothetical protein [Caldimonas brevitalea]AKJ27081.1 hypothetical protein AAW51_0390 [Caldimonas brevitalea]
MQSVVVTFDRVFDVQRLTRGRSGPKYTLFGFESAGKRYFNVEVDGWPELEAGATVTALLRTPGNWRTLVGWVEHGSQRIVGPDDRETRRSALVGVMVAVVLFGFILNSKRFAAADAAGPWATFVAAMVCAVAVVSMFFLAYRQTKDLRALKALQDSLTRGPSAAGDDGG